MLNDQEIKKKYKIFADPDNVINLVHLQESTDDEENTRKTELLSKEMFAILEQHTEIKYHVLIDVMAIPSGGKMSAEARKIYMKIAAHPRTRKVAMVGGSPSIKGIAGLILKYATNIEDMKWFVNRTSALNWLQQE